MDCSRPSGTGSCPECGDYEIDDFDITLERSGESSEPSITWTTLSSGISGAVSKGEGPPAPFLLDGPANPGDTVWIKTSYKVTFTLKVGRSNPSCVRVKLTSTATGICYPNSGIPSGIGEAANGFGDPSVTFELNPPAQKGATSTGYRIFSLPLDSGGVASYQVVSNASATAVALCEHIDAVTILTWEILSP